MLRPDRQDSRMCLLTKPIEVYLMRIVKNALACLMLLFLITPTVTAQVGLNTKGLRIEVQPETGFIHRITMQSDTHDEKSGFWVFKEGSLLALDWPQAPTLNSQFEEIQKDGSTAIVSRYSGPAGLDIERRLSAGSSEFLINVSYSIKNGSQQTAGRHRRAGHPRHRQCHAGGGR